MVPLLVDWRLVPPEFQWTNLYKQSLEISIRVTFWEQYDGVTNLLDNDLVPLKAELLGEPNGLAVAIDKQSGSLHDGDPTVAVHP